MDNQLLKYCESLKKYIFDNYKLHFRKAIPGKLEYPFFSSGIDYSTQVWDWGSWLATISFKSIFDKDLELCQKGIILNFLNSMDVEGKMPIVISSESNDWLSEYHNIFKPCLAMHTLEICKKYNDFAWIKDKYEQFERFISYYDKYQKHEETGLYFWLDDFAIGTDNDPTVFYHQDKTVAHLLLNCLMYKELESLSELSGLLNKNEEALKYKEKALKLKDAILEECFDPIDGYFYSADVSLKPLDKDKWLHSGFPRFWKSLPIKVKTWTGILPLWANIATKEQAEKVIQRYLNKEELYSEFGIRSLAKNERMFYQHNSCNPSCWLGPVWVNANYFTYIAFKNYGYNDLAKDIAIKTIKLLGKDLEENGGFHEYYDSNTGKGIRGLGMHGWNFLVLNLINDICDQK